MGIELIGVAAVGGRWECGWDSRSEGGRGSRKGSRKGGGRGSLVSCE